MNMYTIWKKKCYKDISGSRLMYIHTIPNNITTCFFSVEIDKCFWNLCKNERDCYTKTLCCCWVAKSCPTLWLHGHQHARLFCLPPFPRVSSNLCPLNQWCYNLLILCRCLLLLPSIFPTITVFSNELAHCIRWPKH